MNFISANTQISWKVRAAATKEALDGALHDRTLLLKCTGQSGYFITFGFESGTFLKKEKYINHEYTTSPF